MIVQIEMLDQVFVEAIELDIILKGEITFWTVWWGSQTWSQEQSNLNTVGY